MDNLQFWLYVIIGVIYLVAQLRKKSKEQQNMPPQKPVARKTISQPVSRPPVIEQHPSQPKPLTFEELLREITEAKTGRQEPAYETYEKPTYVDYDDDLEDEAKDIEEVTTDYSKTDSFYREYEEAKNKDYSRNTLEDTLKLENVDMNYSKFKEFEDDKKRNLLEEYTRDLRDPEGFKKALVLNEVLNRRHF